MTAFSTPTLLLALPISQKKIGRTYKVTVSVDYGRICILSLLLKLSVCYDCIYFWSLSTQVGDCVVWSICRSLLYIDSYCPSQLKSDICLYIMSDAKRNKGTYIFLKLKDTENYKKWTQNMRFTLWDAGLISYANSTSVKSKH